MGAGSPFHALFSPFRSPSKIAHLENKALPTDSPSVLTAISSATHVRTAQSTERHPSTEATSVYPDIARRHSTEEEPGRREIDARFRRRSLAAAPLTKQLKMKLLLFEEGATHIALVENKERLRQQGVVPDPLTSLRVVSAEHEDWHQRRSLSNTRLQTCPPGEGGGSGNRQRRISPSRTVSWDSDIEEISIISGRYHDAPVLRKASRRLLQIRQRHGLV
eukprot:CAMPEP_0180153682 /NCGR_PEP_ID=MMETSP0986-20121125/23681_1 /TAXON_ID=697907 /ORGANISM="non described non described, Strain CCMP2293" /LENGTH=219 /DNA_ID=CAMNT_0022101837 /DNA_START=190 /DNA_END=849 /DNA_ORIENTATION=-